VTQPAATPAPRAKRRLWPRSLAGQMAVLIALALFVAQAVNFGLALRDRAQFRLAQAARPVAIRIADAVERHNALKRVELALELTDRPAYPESYSAVAETLDDMERDFL